VLTRKSRRAEGLERGTAHHREQNSVGENPRTLELEITAQRFREE
jgi:hypothetical protein